MSPVRNGHAVRAIPEYAYGKTKNVEQSKNKTEKKREKQAEQGRAMKYGRIQSKTSKATNSKYS